jgi:hypothetical protein
LLKLAKKLVKIKSSKIFLNKNIIQKIIEIYKNKKLNAINTYFDFSNFFTFCKIK